MKVKNGENLLSKFNSGNNGLVIEKIPILKLPKNDDIIICSMFNKNNQSIDILFINKNSAVLEQNKIDNWPVENVQIVSVNYQSIIHHLLMRIKFQNYIAMNAVKIKGKKSNYLSRRKIFLNIIN